MTAFFGSVTIQSPSITEIGTLPTSTAGWMCSIRLDIGWFSIFDLSAKKIVSCRPRTVAWIPSSMPGSYWTASISVGLCTNLIFFLMPL